MADYTTTQLAAARAALAAGVTRVSHEGTTTEYRSLAELKETIAIMESDLNADDSRVRTRVLRIASTKDL